MDRLQPRGFPLDLSLVVRQVQELVDWMVTGLLEGMETVTELSDSELRLGVSGMVVVRVHDHPLGVTDRCRCYSR